jgi:polyisoprenoid-binding protein YceI
MAATRWNVDAAHSAIEFAVRHLMLSTVKGHFTDFSGTVAADEANPSSSQIEVTIQVASINTRQPDRDAHLKSPDFFDAEKYPTITFKGKRVSGDIKGEFKLTGDLTMHGATKEVTLDVTAEGRGIDPWGNDRAGFSAKGKLDRRDWGLTWNQPLQDGVAVGHEVKLTLDVEIVKAAATPAAGATA